MRWFNPRTGGPLQGGSTAAVTGGGRRPLGQPPRDQDQDWLAVLRPADPDRNYPPGVTITEPEEGTAFDQGTVVRFSATVSDPDGIAETKWVSSVDGVLRTSIHEGMPANSMQSFSTSTLSAGRHDIYCFAYDERILIGEDSVAITVGDETAAVPLFVVIASPRSEADFVTGEGVTFSARTADPEDGSLSGDSLVWTSDKDGGMGTGQEITVDSLSLGTHTITLEAANSRGEKETDTITLTIIEGTLPDDTTTTTSPGAETTTSTTPGSGTISGKGSAIIAES